MRLLVVIMLFLCSVPSFSQERVTTFGVQMKPIIPSNLFRAGATELSQNGVDYSLNQQVGYSFGGVMRFGLNKWLSLESGISFVRRNFSAQVYHEELSFADTTEFRIIGYEIPISGLVFVRLSDKIYMNASFGLALDMFPSDVSSGTSQDFYQYSLRTGFANSNSILNFVKTGLIANIGFEYRTKESGYFYIGASYHRPFSPIYNTGINYTYTNSTAKFEDLGVLQLSGNYLTIDFKYFFNEEKREKKVERDPSTMPSWMKN